VRSLLINSFCVESPVPLCHCGEPKLRAKGVARSAAVPSPLHEIASALSCPAMTERKSLAATPPLFVIASPDESGRGNLRYDQVVIYVVDYVCTIEGRMIKFMEGVG
jgi:hypothetical protein